MIPILSTITAACKALAAALGLVDKGLDRKAGVDAQRAADGDATLEVQTEVTDAAGTAMGWDDRDANPVGWLRARPGGVPGQADPETAATAARVRQSLNRRRGKVDS